MKTCQACPPNFQFFRTNFASSKVLSVVVRISRPSDSPITLLLGVADRDVFACVFCPKIKFGYACSGCAQQGRYVV
jgi:hypothetical protein